MTCSTMSWGERPHRQLPAVVPWTAAARAAARGGTGERAASPKHSRPHLCRSQIPHADTHGRCRRGKTGHGRSYRANGRTRQYDMSPQCRRTITGAAIPLRPSVVRHRPFLTINAQCIATRPACRRGLCAGPIAPGRGVALHKEVRRDCGGFVVVAHLCTGHRHRDENVNVSRANRCPGSAPSHLGQPPFHAPVPRRKLQELPDRRQCVSAVLTAGSSQPHQAA
jgi:hypothetical protein